MSTWVGVAPVIGAGSLDGFAVGALMSGACFLAITAPRRTRKRQVAVAGDSGTRASRRRERLHRRVMAAGAFDHGPAWAARPGDARVLDASGRESVADRDGKNAGGYRSRHRLGGPARNGPAHGAPHRAARRDAAIPDYAFSGPTPRNAGHQHRLRSRSVFPEHALSGIAPRSGAYSRRTRSADGFPDSAFPDTPLRGRGCRKGASPAPAFPGAAFPDAALSDLAFPDGTLGPSRRQEARRLPRHAAPAVGFGSRVSNWMADLFAARVVASGARG